MYSIALFKAKRFGFLFILLSLIGKSDSYLRVLVRTYIVVFAVLLFLTFFVIKEILVGVIGLVVLVAAVSIE